MNIEKYAELEQFFGWFNQDWMDDYPTFEAVIEAYKNQWPKEDMQQARLELEELLASVHDEKELKNIVVFKLGCCYYPGDGTTYRAWLEKVLELLANEKK